VDALEVAQEATQLLQADARARQVELTSELGGSCRIRGDRSALFTVVSNLARNAVEAVDDGGHVHVQVQREGDQVDIGVRDDGPGMSPGTQQEIFVQHFTTKTGGAGLGLGLVRRAVDSLGGSLQVRSDPGQGTSIHVLLPAHDLRGQEQTEETDSLRLPLRRYSGVQERRPSRIEGEVLIVEDDPALRELMLTTLQMRGANVTAAVNVAEAFQYPGPYDVALIDLTLPDGRGDELLAELRRRGAVRSAALVSGAEPTGLDGAAAPDTWLRKPFDPVDLIATAAELARSAGDSNRTQGQSG
jgi:CheY-like chemotaxis protein